MNNTVYVYRLIRGENFYVIMINWNMMFDKTQEYYSPRLFAFVIYSRSNRHIIEQQILVF